MVKQISSSLTAAVMLLVVILGAWMSYLEPEKALVWALGIFMLPAAWVALWLFKRVGVMTSMSQSDEMRIRRALTGASLFIAATFGVILSETLHVIDDTTGERVMGVVLGAVLVVVGNYLPKALEPQWCEPSKVQSLQRFAGWTFVLAGLTYALVWLIVPVDRADVIATPIVAAAAVLVAGRMVWLLATRKRVHPPAGL